MHLNDLFPSCSAFRFLFWENIAWQIIESNGFFTLWTNVLCIFKCSIKISITSYTCKWLLSFMNGIIVSFQNSFLRKSDLTNVTSSGFVSSWTELMCTLKFTKWEKVAWQILHLNGFFPSWTDLFWTFKFSFVPKIAPQASKDFCPSWANVMCLFKLSFQN